jgi:ABC-2 type transport system ATP-binding protein
MLSIAGLTHVYDAGVTALQDVNLVISPGMFGLLGPNGAGKSIPMWICATLQLPSCDQVRFDGIDVLRNPEPVRRVLGYPPQYFGVFPRVSAYRMLDHMAVLKGLSVRP